jgi:putative ABC transport system permease protein
MRRLSRLLLLLRKFHNSHPKYANSRTDIQGRRPAVSGGVHELERDRVDTRLVGGIGIMNVLLSSVTERTREIGIRKATGAQDRDIHLQFLAESVAISGVGSAIGLVIGIAGAFGITSGIRRFSNAPFLSASLSWSTVLVAVLAAVIVGLVFGTYPARRAARLSPIDAIRHE